MLLGNRLMAANAPGLSSHGVCSSRTQLSQLAPFLIERALGWNAGSRLCPLLPEELKVRKLGLDTGRSKR